MGMLRQTIHEQDGGYSDGIVVKCATIPGVIAEWRTGELAAIVTIRMFVPIPPVRSLLRAVEFVEGTINFMPFSPPAPVPAVFAVIPPMIVPVVPVVIPSLVPFIPLSGISTAVVSKIVAGLEPYRGNESHT
jgi:hypothetical protein